MVILRLLDLAETQFARALSATGSADHPYLRATACEEPRCS